MFEYVCPVCGREFTSPYSVQTCSRRCGGMVAAWKMLRPGLPFDREEMAAICDRRKMRGKTQSRARQLRHAQTWDGISDDEILERDGWRCQIPGCKRRPIRKDAAYPHPRSPSVDHIIPLSLGGDDTAVNKRAAHLVCNVARGNRVGVEQLPLFGVVREPPLATVTAGERAAMFQRPERKHWPSRTVCFPNCAHCGKLFTAHTRRAKFCSLKCRNASRFPSLRYCGCGQQLLPGRHKCDDCKLRGSRSCEICERRYDPWYNGQRSCSRACGVELKRRNGRAA